MKLILASKSSARRQMLNNAGFVFETVPADIGERQMQSAHLSSGKAVDDLAIVLANAKARSISMQHPTDLVIGSDQVLVCAGEVMNKVSDLQQARTRLSALQGRSHKLVSTVACWFGGRAVFQCADSATLTMYRLASKEIDQYLSDAGESILGSVGCYEIEGKGIRLFRSIEGSHFTIMGMPLLQLTGFLRQYNKLAEGDR